MNESKVIFDKPVTFPLDMEQMEQVMEDRSSIETVEAPLLRPSIMGFIDYKNTNQYNRGVALINFVANLNLSFRLVVDHSIDKEDRMGLLLDFMDVRAISDIPTLRQTVEVILLEKKLELAGTPPEKSDKLDENVWLTFEERQEFRKNNAMIVEEWMNFIDNVIVMRPFHSKWYAADMGKQSLEKGEIKKEEGKNVVGLNVGTLLASQGFLEKYFSFQRTAVPTIYEHYMFDPVFRGESMMSILMKGNSMLMRFMMEMFDTDVPVEKIAEELQKVAKDEDGPDNKAD